MNSSSAKMIYTIGHSTRSFDKLVNILRAHQIDELVDIRTIPHSKHNPQFNRDVLDVELPKAGIAYRHAKELGGLRHASKPSINAGWKNPSFRGYADYMQTDDFEAAVSRLIELGAERRIAIMCAEGNPYRCHRSLVADALVARGLRVMHISSRTSSSKHRLTPFARIHGTLVTYPEE